MEKILPEGVIMYPRFDSNIFKPGRAIHIYDGNKSFNGKYLYDAIVVSIKHNELEVAVYDSGAVRSHIIDLDRVISSKVEISLLKTC